MIRYEYPFNEGIRTMLRLEPLFARLQILIGREAALDHHYAVATLFEIIDVASRADLKSDLLKELERQGAQLATYRGKESICETALEHTLQRVDETHAALNQLPGKAGQALTANDWLMAVRSRISIPGGTCEFDLPGYYAWRHESISRRQADLRAWAATLQPLGEALRVLLGLLRESGTPHMVVAPGGVFQHGLPPGRSFQLLRVRFDEASGWVPEISGHRLMLSVRLMRSDPEGRLRPLNEDASFELTLCA